MEALNGRSKKVLACVLVMAMIASAILIPVMHEETEEADASVLDDINNTLDDIYETLAVVSDWSDGEYTVGLFGPFPMIYTNTGSNSSTNDASNAYDAIDMIIDYVTEILSMIKDTVGFSSSYFQRMCEVAAAETWYSGGTMDSDIILANSQTYDFTTKIVLNYLAGISSAFNYLVGSSLDQTFTVGSYTINPKSIDAETDQLVSFGMGTAITSTSSDKVYIYPGETDDYGYIYVYGGSATITDSEGNNYTLSEGKNSLDDLAKGTYELQANRTYVGSIYQCQDSDAATVCPAVFIQGSSGNAYVLETSDGTSKIYYNGSTTTTTSSILYNITDSDSTSSVNLSLVFDIIRGIMAANTNMIVDCISSAQTAWMIFNTAGESSVFVSPSALIPNLANMDFTTSQAYLIYMSALEQMTEFYETASGNFEASDVTISEDSLDLVCYGTIYSDSTMVTATASDIYFTPMCYERDQAILVGNTPFLQPGLAMVWVSDGKGGYVAGGLIVLESGMYLSVSAINYRGIQYDSVGDGVTLQVKSLTEISGYGVNEHEDTDDTSNNDLAIILIVVGVIFLAIAYFAEIRLLALIGIILILLGLAIIFVPSAIDWLKSINPFVISAAQGGS